MLMRRASSGGFDPVPDGRESEKLDGHEGFSFALRMRAEEVSYAAGARELNGA
jgi:hypothetical protein